MGKVGLHRQSKWHPAARFGCLGVFILCGILLAGPIAAIWEAHIWEEPSLETRKQVDAALGSCTLKESELPNGWSKDLPLAFPPYGKPTPTGMLGGILTIFSLEASSADMAAFQELRFYEKTHRAALKYKSPHTGFIPRLYRTWVPLDLRKANLSADEYQARCSYLAPDRGPERRESICRVEARYGRFFSVFDTYVSSSNISMEEYIQLLQTIDRKMLQCVGAFGGKKWREDYCDKTRNRTANIFVRVQREFRCRPNIFP